MTFRVFLSFGLDQINTETLKWTTMAAAKGSYLDAEDGMTFRTIVIGVEREPAVADCANLLGAKSVFHGLASTTVSMKTNRRTEIEEGGESLWLDLVSTKAIPTDAVQLILNRKKRRL